MRDPDGAGPREALERAEPTAISFGRIAAAMREALDSEVLGHIDDVVAIARGGVVAGALAAYHLKVPLRLLRLRFRDDSNAPLGVRPELASDVPNVRGKRVLVVDDVGVSGATLRVAREVLDATVVTLVVKGRAGVADVVLIDDVPECVRWPWHEDVADTRGAVDREVTPQPTKLVEPSPRMQSDAPATPSPRRQRPD